MLECFYQLRPTTQSRLSLEVLPRLIYKFRILLTIVIVAHPALQGRQVQAQMCRIDRESTNTIADSIRLIRFHTRYGNPVQVKFN
jgi:hypothetical protein